MKLCMYNDCQCGPHMFSITCKDCPEEKCPDRCKNTDCTGCYWMTEVKDDESAEGKFIR